MFSSIIAFHVLYSMYYAVLKISTCLLKLFLVRPKPPSTIHLVCPGICMCSSMFLCRPLITRQAKYAIVNIFLF